MDEMNKITEQMINEITDKDNGTSTKDRVIIESVKKLDNPFKMITVKDVMEDLNICKTVAYRLFQRKDFPSICIGKSNQIMLLTYILWKIDRKS